MVLVVEAFEGLVALYAREGPGVAAFAGAMFVNLLLLEGGEAALACEYYHYFSVRT